MQRNRSDSTEVELPGLKSVLPNERCKWTMFISSLFNVSTRILNVRNVTQRQLRSIFMAVLCPVFVASMLSVRAHFSPNISIKVSFVPWQQKRPFLWGRASEAHYYYISTKHQTIKHQICILLLNKAHPTVGCYANEPLTVLVRSLFYSAIHSVTVHIITLIR